MDLFSTKDPLLSHVLLNAIIQPLREKMAVPQPFLTDFGSFQYNSTPKDPLFSYVLLKVITQTPMEKMAITQVFLDQFWIFLV